MPFGRQHHRHSDLCRLGSTDDRLRVVGVHVESADRILLDTVDARSLARALAPTARGQGATVLEVRAVDEDLEDVFRYLVSR